MVSSKQKRVWRYVDEGNPLKLKSYLKKHPDTDVNFSMGKKQRSPLHLACRLGDGYLLRLLLDHGADVLRRDSKGETAMHEAVKRHMKYKAGGGKNGPEVGVILLYFKILKLNQFFFFFFSVRRPIRAAQEALSGGRDDSQQRRCHAARSAGFLERKGGKKKTKLEYVTDTTWFCSVTRYIMRLL